ncbi:hypothetical protein AB4Z48_31125 [Cupriavidus sp. 2TAF22]|uniref:hypothetical protein n=1 Tax=unclassified Cupriavidus TaxID=2640874 RepID=UPI003F91E27F
MNKDELHAILTTEFDLVTDPAERGDGRSYFLREVIWHPASVTRILRAQYGPGDRVSRIRLCVSSDNNNSVFLAMPASREALHSAVLAEIAGFVAVAG